MALHFGDQYTFGHVFVPFLQVAVSTLLREIRTFYDEFLNFF